MKMISKNKIYLDECLKVCERLYKKISNKQEEAITNLVKIKIVAINVYEKYANDENKHHPILKLIEKINKRIRKIEK